MVLHCWALRPYSSDDTLNSACSEVPLLEAALRRVEQAPFMMQLQSYAAHFVELMYRCVWRHHRQLEGESCSLGELQQPVSTTVWSMG